MSATADLVAENKALIDKLAGGIEARLLRYSGVIHVSVGLKEKDDKVTDQLCFRVYVRDKQPPDSLTADALVPAEIEGVATDINVVSTPSFQSDQGRYRPIRGGIEISNRIVDANEALTGTVMSRGTLGCIAIDKTDDAPVMLSNWHVLFAGHARPGDRIYQPAPTLIPPANLADLPLRPTDDNDKVGAIRRNALSAKVDGAIAAIDVSSCCHCCGIHFSNEFPGLSVGGRPSRNTIVGDQSAVSGMSVFKIGKTTLRTEGKVVDANYPSFSIVKGGTTHTFNGQIAIKNIDETKPFGDHGDSGAVVINSDSKIVGLYFSAGRNPGSGGAPDTYIALANHISDVFSELNIRIDYSPDVIVTAGAGLADTSVRVLEAPIPEPYRAFRDRLARDAAAALVVEAGQDHQDEVVRLVNQCRPVTVAWRRAEGPAWLVTLMGRVRDGRADLPDNIRGISLADSLRRMRAALSTHGSAALRDRLALRQADDLIAACQRGAGIEEIIAAVSARAVVARAQDA